MSLAKGTINPLNVLGIRKLTFIPAHFSKITFSNLRNIEEINRWIYSNLNSRYCIRLKQSLNTDKKIIEIIEVGFEEPKELTMFSLSCPHLNKNN
jgi:hypothetical protein